MATPIVTMEAHGARPSLDASGPALTPIVWLIQDLPHGDNPLDVFGVPKRGNVITLYGTVYTCDKVDTPEQINDNVFRVQTWFSTDQRWDVLNPRIGDDERNFLKSYKKVDVLHPTFKRTYELTQNNAGTNILKDKWTREDLNVQQEWEVLSINVVLEVNNDAQILAAMTAADAQVGFIHIFPYNLNKKWLHLPNEQRRLAKKLTISYSWLSDPGNGAMGLEPSDPDAASTVYPGDRNPFHIYRTVLGANPADVPEIKTVPLFPTYNTRAQMTNGWLTLPGNPI